MAHEIEELADDLINVEARMRVVKTQEEKRALAILWALLNARLYEGGWKDD